MTLKRFPALLSFFSTTLSDSVPDDDEQTTKKFVESAPSDRQSQLVSEINLLIAEAELSLEELGAEANRWFGDAAEARDWLGRILAIAQSSQTAGQDIGTLIVKDSNGTPLAEGDSVIVIKDLKVKGGSSDLKRGTPIKKIHLVDDPEVVECRVDGSTLVLKTCFLKKA
jgi:protein PhnA